MMEHHRRQLDLIDLFLFALVAAVALVLRMVGVDAVGEVGGEAAIWNAVRAHFDGLMLDDVRFVSALLGACGCGVLYLAGRDLIGRGCGLLAGALCAVVPQSVAQGRLAGLETASSLLVLLAVWLFYRGLRRQQEGENSGYDLAAGLCVGLALAAQLENIYVLLVLLLMYLSTHWSTIRSERRFPVSLTTGLLPVVAAAAFVAAEPRLWRNVVLGFGNLLRQFGLFDRLPAESAFIGPHYLSVLFVATTPVAVLVLAAVGLGSAIAGQAADEDGPAGPRTIVLLLIVPFLVRLVVLDGGVEAIASVLAGTCLLAALGADLLGRLAGRVLLRELRVPVMAVIGAAAGIYVLYASVQLHPYYQLYYNEIFGGLETVAANRSFPVGRRGEGLTEAGAYLESNAKKNAKVFVDAGPSDLVRLRSDLRKVNDAREADFVVHNQRGSWVFDERGFGEVFAVRVLDVPLVRVFNRAQ